MFSVRKAHAMAGGYIPNKRMIYERIMNETRGVLVSLERRFQTFSQQQNIFVTALDRCRKTNFQPKERIVNIAQVYNYSVHVSDNATDKRIFNMFLTLVRDLGEFRRTLSKLGGQKSDPKLNEIFSTWKRILETRQDITSVRARFPYCHVNHLSCDEARNHFGGIISVIPVAMQCAKEAVERIEVTRAYRDMTAFNGRKSESRESASDSKMARMRCRATNERSPQRPAPTCRLAQPPSPVMSSPLPTNTPSEVSIDSSVSLRSATNRDRKRTVRIERPVSASCSQRARPPTPMRSQSQSGKTTQTPHYLAATLKPSLAWPHKTVSEAEMLKLMRRHKNTVVKPGWKP